MSWIVRRRRQIAVFIPATQTALLFGINILMKVVMNKLEIIVDLISITNIEMLCNQSIV